MDETTGPSDAASTSGPAQRRPSLLLAGLLLVAFNLRPVLTSVGPLIDDIRRDLGLSSTEIGFLTTAPLIAFGVIAPLAPVLAFRFGMERVLLGCLVLLGGSLALRLAPSVPLLFIGTLAAGCGIAVANVLLPALVKRRYAERAAFVTGLYAMALGGGAALAAGLAVPSAHWLGGSWRGALALWSLPALVAAVVWTGDLRDAPASSHASGGARSRVRLGRDAIAWQVTVLMGIQSLLFYSTVAWLPEILRSHGIGAGAAGALLSMALIVGIPAGLVVAVAAGRMPDQRSIAAIATGIVSVGFVGLLVAPAAAAAVWAVLLGGGLGAWFTLTLTLMVLRAPDARHAAALSGMAQSVGYLLAAIGPVAVGALHDLTDGWTASVAVLLALTVPGLAASLGASRARMVGTARAA
jgi:MFS transporter, CP family, cyanate transporter